MKTFVYNLQEARIESHIEKLNSAERWRLHVQKYFLITDGKTRLRWTV